MSSYQKQELFLKKIKDKDTDAGNGVPNKKNSEYVYVLIHIANYFPKLRD